MATEAFRRRRFARLIEMSSGVGLEIDALDRPVALRPQHRVSYVDVLDRDGLIRHYDGDPNVAKAEIVDVDYALISADGSKQALAEAASPGAPYDWVIASHVIEHVPDLVTWLFDIAALTEPGAVLALAVPDRRFSFDVLRPQTTVGQILQAYDARDTVPSVRAVYDHFRSAVSTPASALWSGESPRPDARIHQLDDAMSQVTKIRERGTYIDSHVWTFTPACFLEQIDELHQLGLCQFVVDRLISTAPSELEFYAVLRRVSETVTPSTCPEHVFASVESLQDCERMYVSENERKLLKAKRFALRGLRRVINAFEKRTDVSRWRR